MKSDLQELFDELDLEFWFDREGVSHQMSRGRSGMQINPKECPECGDRRYRVYLNADTGLGNCFVCNFAFNKSKFIHSHLGTSWRDTINHVKQVLSDQGWRPKRMTSAATFDDIKIVLPDSFPLPTLDGRNLIYLEKRGITAELSKYFHFRFCEDGWWRFTKDDGSPGGQNFANRVIIPVYDLDGALKTFQGRDVTDASDRKYLFPKELPGTGRYLYNGQNAVRAKRVVMGEGAMDVAAIKKAFDEEVSLRDVIAVGSFGKHLSYGALNGDDQLGRFIQLKNDGLEEVTIMWDGEFEALLSALEAAELLHRVGLKVRVALLPAGRDPNEVTPDVVRQAYFSAKPYTKLLGVHWRINNPYPVHKKPVSFDCHPAH